VKVRFLGAIGCVTGSRHLLETRSGKRILIDCGMFQGSKELRLRNWADFPVPPASIDAVILTHAHIDHSGYLPRLMMNGFRGPVFVTPATLDLCSIMLLDSAHLHEEDARYANRKGFSKHTPALPLYTVAAAEKAMGLFKKIEFDSPFSPVPDVKATFYRVGHILGAACVKIEIDGESILFSGDVGRPTDPILRPPVKRPTADYVVIESTYGNREHVDTDLVGQLKVHINRTIERGGIVLVPAFSVGRTQLLLEAILQLQRKNEIPKVPVYLNSPMSIRVNGVFCKHAEETKLSSEEVQEICETAIPVVDVEESRDLNSRRESAIIIAANGMATGGRVLHHLKGLVGSSKHTILFTGYQAEGTRGAKMLAGEPTIRIHGEDLPVKAEVAVLDNVSAHADGSELMDWLKSGDAPPKSVFITHGEPDASAGLRLRIETELGWKVEDSPQ
jgi:metallo-beta-lactamase family protein